MIRYLNIILLLVLVWYLNGRFQENKVQPLDASASEMSENKIDYYSENLLIRQFDDEGKLQSILKTERLDHYADKQLISLSKPEIILYEQGVEPKYLSSERGEINDRTHDLTLIKNVRLVVGNDSSQDQDQALEISTAKLSYAVATQQLRTDEPVKGLTQDGAFESQQLLMNVKTEQLSLNNKVKIHYQQYDIDVAAEQFTSNPTTKISRLKDNVTLQRKGMFITGDSAEIQLIKDLSKIFIIAGEPINLSHNIDSLVLTASASQLIYLPAIETIELDENVQITQQTEDVNFNISADHLQMQLSNEKPKSMKAQGSPLFFIHQLAEGSVKIKAKTVHWVAETNIATLTEAVIVDGLTQFSADEIKYNTLTGESSAVGNDGNRPNYIYKPKKDSTD